MWGGGEGGGKGAGRGGGQGGDVVFPNMDFGVNCLEGFKSLVFRRVQKCSPVFRRVQKCSPTCICRDQCCAVLGGRCLPPVFPCPAPLLPDLVEDACPLCPPAPLLPDLVEDTCPLFPPAPLLPDLVELVEKEDACPLCLANRLHDPCARTAPELLHKHAVLARDHVREREEVVLGGLGVALLRGGRGRAAGEEEKQRTKPWGADVGAKD